MILNVLYNKATIRQIQGRFKGNSYTKHKKNIFTFETVLEIFLWEMMTTPFSQDKQLRCDIELPSYGCNIVKQMTPESKV